MASLVKEYRPHSSKNTLADIIEAAAVEFAAHGLDGARMDKIAEGAKVTKQLIYHYYGSKEQLYIAVLEHFAEVSLREMQTYDYENLEPVDAFRLFMNSLFDLHIRFPCLAALTVDQNSHRAAHITRRNKTHVQTRVFIETLDLILERGARLGEFRSDVDANLFFASAVTVSLACFCDGNTISLCVNTDARTPEFIAYWREYSVNFLLSALGNDVRKRPPLTADNAMVGLGLPPRPASLARA